MAGALFTENIERLRDAFRELVQAKLQPIPSLIRALQRDSGWDMEAHQSGRERLQRRPRSPGISRVAMALGTASSKIRSSGGLDSSMRLRPPRVDALLIE